MIEATLKAHELCLDQAEGFLLAAERLELTVSPHIIYHLSLLALEEVGKAGMLKGLAVTGRKSDETFLDRWLTSHRRKLTWAVWSPLTRIDPAEFREAQAFAERAHALRLSSLYVDPSADVAALPPADRVSAEHAGSVLKLARTRLAYERSLGAKPPRIDELTEWFLETVSDEEASQRLFSRPFIEKYEALEGDVHQWASWAREEFERLETDLRETMAREWTRPAAATGETRTRWRANATVYSPSHALRSKVLADWNAKISFVQLLWIGKKDQFTLQILLDDSLPFSDLAGRLATWAKISVACLNIGSLGYFWFERAGFEQEMFKGIWDVELDRPLKLRARESFWGDGRAVALTTTHIDHAIHCMLAFASLPEAVAEPIFKPYFDGLAFIAKSDAYYNLDVLARHAFVSSLGAALHHYGEWNGEPETFEAAFHAGFAPFMPEAAHREQVFRALTPEGDRGETTLANLRSAKHLTDMYLIHVARRTWKSAIKAAETSVTS